MLLQGAHKQLHNSMDWDVFDWHVTPQHRALVFKPQSSFDAQVLEEMVRGNLQGVDVTMVSSERLFIVIELCVDSKGGTFFPQISVLPSFNPKRSNVSWIGKSKDTKLMEISMKADAIIATYSSYGLIGCNCQHFVFDLGSSLGFCLKAPLDHEIISGLGVTTKVTSGVICFGKVFVTGGTLANPVPAMVAATVAAGVQGWLQKGYRSIHSAHRILTPSPM